MIKVHIPQKNLILEASQGMNLMDVLIHNGLPVASSCRGEGVCSKCYVQIEPNSTPLEFEQKTMIRNHVPDGCRLSCQVELTENVTVKTRYW